MRQCSNCREPMAATETVVTQNGVESWCGFCRRISAATCVICQGLFDCNYVYEISRWRCPPLDAKVCPDDLIKWAAGQNA